MTMGASAPPAGGVQHPARGTTGPEPTVATRRRVWLPAVVFVTTIGMQLALLATGPTHVGLAVLALAAAAALVLAGLGNPTVAVALLLVAAFFRLALPTAGLPVEPWVLAFGGVLGAGAIAIAKRVHQLPQLGAVEAVMVLYLAWNIGSALAPHSVPAMLPTTGEPFDVWRFIVTGTLLPFVLYVVGRFVFDRPTVMRRLLWIVLCFAGYSTVVSLLQFHGPAALVWPRYIVSAPNWPGRAVGVFNQPVVNGLILVFGFVIALYIASQRDEPQWRRACAAALAVTSVYAIYLTHTRAVWLAFALVLVAGAVWARGFRTGFVALLVATVLAVGANWSTFTSTDRSAGGVASTNEVHDRLNMAATAFWAIQEKPVAGWGIGRFTMVNTYHHKQWAPEIQWERGYGFAAHHNELGIATELGLVGVALWLGVLALVLHRLIRAARTLPAAGICGRGLAIVALLACGCWVLTASTVDMRFFGFPNALVWLLAGAVVGAADRARPAVPSGRDRHLAVSR